jgi:tetratricopeptide (TPR) repeat protein
MAKYLVQTSASRRLKDKVANFLDDETDPMLDTEKLAYHYEMSEQWLEAARLLLHAAENFKQTQATNEPLFTRSLNLLEHYAPNKVTPEIGREKARAHQALGNVALKRLDLATAATSYESALSDLSADPTSGQTANLTARLCLILPSQGKIEAAEKYLAKALGQYPNDWKLRMVSAWLAWRAGKDAKPQIAACRAFLPKADSDSMLRAQALLAELEGDFEKAAEAYQLLNEINSAAATWIQSGDQLLKQRNYAEAARQYELATNAWKADPCGMALTRYRLAEIEWMSRRATRTISLLKDALAYLEKAPPQLQSEPRASIQKALTRVNTKSYGEWKYWRWQPFDDIFRIQFCLPIFEDT